MTTLTKSCSGSGTRGGAVRCCRRCARPGFTVDHSEAGLYLWASRGEPCRDSVAWLAAARHPGGARRVLRPGRREARAGCADRHRRAHRRRGRRLTVGRPGPRPPAARSEANGRMHPEALPMLRAQPRVRSVVVTTSAGTAGKLRIPADDRGHSQAGLSGKAADHREPEDREAVEPRCAWRTFAGCDLVDRLRHRADLDRIVAGCRAGGFCVVASYHRRHLGDSGVGDRVVSAGGHGLHPGGRVLHRRAGELRAPGGAGRRGGAVDRLRRHGGGAGGGGHGCGGVGDPRVGSLQPGKSRSAWCFSSATRTCAGYGKRAGRSRCQPTSSSS